MAKPCMHVCMRNMHRDFQKCGEALGETMASSFRQRGDHFYCKLSYMKHSHMENKQPLGLRRTSRSTFSMAWLRKSTIGFSPECCALFCGSCYCHDSRKTAAEKCLFQVPTSGIQLFRGLHLGTLHRHIPVSAEKTKLCSYYYFYYLHKARGRKQKRIQAANPKP